MKKSYRIHKGSYSKKGSYKVGKLLATVHPKGNFSINTYKLKYLFSLLGIVVLTVSSG